MKILATAALISIALGSFGCAASNANTMPAVSGIAAEPPAGNKDPDVRTRVMSPDGQAFLECRGADGCDEDAVNMFLAMPAPTQAELDKFRQEWIYKLENPPHFVGCDDLPVIPWSSWKIVDGGPSANLPGYSFYMDGPSEWTAAERARRPQVRETDQPIGKVQQGEEMYLIYRVQETSDLVACSIMSGSDIPPNTCDVKYREPLRYCSYSQTIVRGH